MKTESITAISTYISHFYDYIKVYVSSCFITFIFIAIS